MQDRKGYPSKTAIPVHVLGRLNAGKEETKTMSEAMAMNQSTLLRAVLPGVLNPGLSSELRSADGLVSRMRIIGDVLARRPADLKKAISSEADTARGWACFAVGSRPGLSLAERLELIRPFATDSHFGVRDWAWHAGRPFVQESLDEALNLLTEWAKDSSPLIRRFASEVTRPKGVGCPHLKDLKDVPSRGLVILDLLKNDPDVYVQDSVGNWLNDCAKDRPYFVRETIDRWISESDSDATHRIVKKASKYV